MAQIRFFLDTRGYNKDKNIFPVRIGIAHNGKTAFITTSIRIRSDQWDKRDGGKVKNHTNKDHYNHHLSTLRNKIENYLFELIESGLSKITSAVELKSLIEKKLLLENNVGTQSHFLSILESFKSTKKTEGTKGVYDQTKRKLILYLGEEIANNISIEDINDKWLNKFESWLSETQSKNSRNIHLRNIRAIFNYAIDEGITTSYPFRKFKIRPEKTRKRSLSVEKLRLLFNYDCEKYQIKYVDIFKLIFMLCGINMADLTQLKKITDEGRVEYKRSKTHKQYSIKVEPEALDIINKYRGKNYLLDICDRYKNYKDFAHRMTIGLQHIGRMERKGLGGKKIIDSEFPELSPYWARHSWATIAASLDIPKETIAAALGHGGNTVTDIYIDFDQRKVDEANRRVLDWVLYGKK